MSVLDILKRVQEHLQVGMCSSAEKRAECDVCRSQAKLIEDVEKVSAWVEKREFAEHELEIY